MGLLSMSYFLSHYQKFKLRIKKVLCMIAGQMICAIGAGLLTRLALNTPTVDWAAYLVITGISMGMTMQLPRTDSCTQLLYFYLPSTPYD